MLLSKFLPSWKNIKYIYNDIVKPRRNPKDNLYGEKYQNQPTSDYFIYKGQKIPTDFPTVTFDEPNGLKAKSEHMKKVSGDRKINLFVSHWDASLTSRNTQKILDQRGLSVHFLIDNDGTIFQTMDLNDIAFHTGDGYNSTSIGVEIANAYYPKYQKWYVENGFPSRPTWTNIEVHGKKLEPFTGFYQVQINALEKLMKWIYKNIDIPLEVPVKSDGKMYSTVYPEIKKFRGFVGHYHLTERKIDPAGLPLLGIINKIKSEM